MVNNIVFQKDGYKVTIHTRDYEENYTKKVNLIPNVLTKNNRSPGVEVGKSRAIDLMINPERRLTINGYMISDSANSDGDSDTTAINKKNTLRKMMLSGGTATVTFEDNTIFQTAAIEKLSIKKIPLDGQESTYNGIAEYDVTVSIIDVEDY